MTTVEKKIEWCKNTACVLREIMFKPPLTARTCFFCEYEEWLFINETFNKKFFLTIYYNLTFSSFHIFLSAFNASDGNSYFPLVRNTVKSFNCNPFNTSVDFVFTTPTNLTCVSFNSLFSFAKSQKSYGARSSEWG